jgi:acetyl esterase/lipase
MRNIILITGLLLTCLLVQAQKKSPPAIVKKPLTHAVYDGWRDVAVRSITPDGNFAALVINPQDGDGRVEFTNLKTFAVDSVKRADNLTVMFDSRYAIMKIKPQQKLVKDMRRLKKKKEELPRDTMGIYSFAARRVEKIPDVKSFKVPEKAGGWVAYQLEPRKEAKAKGDEKKPKKKKANSDDNGYTLVLRSLSAQQELSFGYVKDYLFAKFGQGLMFTTSGNDSTLKAGAYWYDVSQQKLTALHTGRSKFKYKGLSISEDGTQASFLVDQDTTKALIRHFALYHWKTGASSATLLDVERSLGIPANWVVSEFQTPQFSKDGRRLFFGSAPPPVIQDTTLLTEEIVQVEVWGGNDPYIYPQQNKQLDADRKRAYLGCIDLAEKKIMQLADREVPQITLGDEGNAGVALGETNVPYRRMTTWDPSAFSDFYLFDLNKQVRLPVATRIKANANLSPRAKFIYWFNLTDTAWYSYSVAESKTIRLNRLPIGFGDEENDSPDYPAPYGIAGWTANDESLLAYDRYDIWSFDPEGKRTPINLTRIGRGNKVVFRYIRLDNEGRFIDPMQEMLLSSFNELTKEAGFYRFSLATGKLTRLLEAPYRFGAVVKAKAAPQILFTRESFREFPDVWTADLNFAQPRKISDANPQMKKYLWGTVEPVRWTSLDNIPLQGMLYKPEGFDPTKKYPMIVYFYEKESDNLHQHIKPEPLRSSINRAVYASNGYLVFVPDIVYRIGFPGESAMHCVMPGVTSLMEKGFVDEKNIGIQGHSWGGYQIAYMVTRTNLFKAAEAGAPVANMISAYGGIRWETGISRMFQYEHTQSRIGGTLWEKPQHYVENSPIFFADKIQTPMLLLANDNDGAVPWYQGIEMYMALRRLNKPVWMLNYNGEPHWPVKRENRIDFQTRLMQYFDFYLKGAPEPVWMKKGIPALEKGINKGYEY